MNEKSIKDTIEKMRIEYKHPETLQMERYFDDKCPGCGEGSDAEIDYMKVGDVCGLCDYTLTQDGIKKFENLRKELNFIKNKKIKVDSELERKNKIEIIKKIDRKWCPICSTIGFQTGKKCRNCEYMISDEELVSLKSSLQ